MKVRWGLNVEEPDGGWALTIPDDELEGLDESEYHEMIQAHIDSAFAGIVSALFICVEET